MIRGVSKMRRAFSLAELLVVVGILALLIAITLPPLQFARRQALQTRCTANLQQLGRALGTVHAEYEFYPMPDDGGSPIRYTWIDVLLQRKVLADARANVGAGRVGIGYCPSDRGPDPLNTARNSNLIYPPDRNQHGIDYSYGIGVPLAMGGWAIRNAPTPLDPRPRYFGNSQRNTANRVLAADAYDSGIYNLSGNAMQSDIWNDPTQYDNTMAWRRHAAGNGIMGVANALFQDYHVATLRYDPTPGQQEPINTSRDFLWQPGESVYVNPNDRIEGLYYPNQPPPNFNSIPQGEAFPDGLNPAYYTSRAGWTTIVK